MTNKKLPVHIIFVMVYVVLALVTLLPADIVSKSSLLGYKSLCSFSPVSTIILIALAGLHIVLNKRATAR